MEGPTMSRGIVTLCGSVRFEDVFRKVNSELTLKGWIVLAPGCFDHAFLHQPEHNAELLKDGLDALHKEKIDLSDSVLILNVGGHIGRSTQSELIYALDKGRRIFWFETETSRWFHEGIGESWQEMLPEPLLEKLRRESE